VNKRNYELELVKTQVATKKTNENPLRDVKQRENGMQLDSQQYEQKQQEDSDDDETKLEKAQRLAAEENAKKRKFTISLKDPLQEYAMFEKEKQQSDFEVWDSKKIKIMTAYAKKTEGKEVMIGGGGDKDIDRPIRMGPNKSRLDQLEQKTSSSSSKAGTLISARDFTIQLEKLNLEMLKAWER